MSSGWAGGGGGGYARVGSGILESLSSLEKQKKLACKKPPPCTVVQYLLFYFIYIRSHVFLITGHFLRLFSGIQSRRKGDKSLF
jgi:hypothetical protein